MQLKAKYISGEGTKKKQNFKCDCFSDCICLRIFIYFLTTPPPPSFSQKYLQNRHSATSRATSCQIWRCFPRTRIQYFFKIKNNNKSSQKLNQFDNKIVTKLPKHSSKVICENWTSGIRNYHKILWKFWGIIWTWNETFSWFFSRGCNFFSACLPSWPRGNALSRMSTILTINHFTRTKNWQK